MNPDAQLEAMIKDIDDRRRARRDPDIAFLLDTTTETLERVKSLEKAVAVLLARHGIVVGEDQDGDPLVKDA